MLTDTAPVLYQMVLKYGGPEMLHDFYRPGKEPLTTKYVPVLHATEFGIESILSCSFMDMTWQQNNPPNPADAKDGPQAYDDHLYYSFGVSSRADISDDSLLSFVITGYRRSEPRVLHDPHLQ